MTETQSADQQFARRLRTIVEDNLSNEKFDSESLAKEVHLSRSALHRRLRSMGVRNASQFIREIRLQKAREMLCDSQVTASEASYRVGFGSPAYFSKCFREYYGYPPGETKKMAITEETASGVTGTESTEDSVNKAAGIRWWRKMYILLPLIAGTLAVMILLLNNLYLRPRDKSIVVLPFRNLSGNPDNLYFADGIMEDILNNLYHISDLRVISRTTSEHYRDAGLTTTRIARQVGARNVLEGSIRQEGQMVRISVQLIDARSDQHLWSENYDRTLTNILGLQGEIALRVAKQLNAVISDSEIRRIEELPTANPEAYDSYIRGRFLLHRSINEQRTDIERQGLLGSVQYFEKAVALDSGFTLAYAGMAQAWFDLSAWGWVPTSVGFPKAREYSLRALELDPDCAEALTVLGAYHGWGDRQFEEARKALTAALKLKPDYPVANQYYAQLLMIIGPLEETRMFLDRALQIEPHFCVLHNLNAYVCYFEGKYTEAIKACQTASDLHEGYLFTDWLFFLNYAKLGDGRKASEALQRIVRNYTEGGVSVEEEIAEAYLQSGIEGLFRWMIGTNIKKPLPVFGLNGIPFFVSWWYAILGDKENSIHWLGITMEQKRKRHAFLDLIGSNPDFDILRDDERFLTIISSLGLARYNHRSPVKKPSR